MSGLVEDDFTSDSWAAFEEAMTQAAEVIADGEPLEADVTKAYEDLLNAAEGLVRASDLSSLNGLDRLTKLENLNLRGTFRKDVMGYIEERRPDLLPLYERIYVKRDPTYWADLDGEMAEFCRDIGLEYVTNDDTARRPLEDPPIVVNYFYHERIRKSARGDARCRSCQR